jgi:hypothetical protein
LIRHRDTIAVRDGFELRDRADDELTGPAHGREREVVAAAEPAIDRPLDLSA